MPSVFHAACNNPVMNCLRGGANTASAASPAANKTASKSAAGTDRREPERGLDSCEPAKNAGRPALLEDRSAGKVGPSGLLRPDADHEKRWNRWSDDFRFRDLETPVALLDIGDPETLMMILG